MSKHVAGGDMRALIAKVAAYAADVRAMRFPGQAELYSFKPPASESTGT